MKCSLGISNFLEEISSLSHPIVFLYFFALVTEEGFLISPCYSWELWIQMGLSSLFSFPFASLFFSAIFKASPNNRRMDVFELWCWRRLLRVPWTARRSNQSILKEISPEYSLERLMLKLKLQYSGHLMWRTDSMEKTLMLGKIESRKKRGKTEMTEWYHWLDGHEFEQVPEIGDGQWWKGRPGMLQSTGWQSRTQLSNWSELNCRGSRKKLSKLPKLIYSVIQLEIDLPSSVNPNPLKIGGKKGRKERRKEERKERRKGDRNLPKSPPFSFSPRSPGSQGNTAVCRPFSWALQKWS